jgi:hypothetical protein
VEIYLTIEETTQVLTMIEIGFVNFYKSLEPTKAKATVSLWAEMFADVPYILVSTAVKIYINTDKTGYPPTVGKINDIIHNLLNGGEVTAQEGIQPIIKAVKNSAYHAPEEFEKLPPNLKKLVGSAEQLRTWASVGEAEFNTVVVSHLIRAYNDSSKNDSIMAAIPESVKAVIKKQAKELEDKKGEEQNENN